MSAVRHTTQDANQGVSGEQIRLIPDPLTPSQIAFKRAHRFAKAVQKHGPGEGKHRTRQLCAALREGLNVR